MQIALLDIGRQAGARPAALDIANDQRHLGHRRPTDRFALERDAGSGAAGDGEISGKGKAQGQGDRTELVLGLNEYAAVFWQLGPQIFVINPRTKMFLPLSLAVPPSASTVRPVMGTPTYMNRLSSRFGSTLSESYRRTPPSFRKSRWS